MLENTALGTEFARNFCVGIGPLQLGVVLVPPTTEMIKFNLNNNSTMFIHTHVVYYVFRQPVIN